MTTPERPPTATPLLAQLRRVPAAWLVTALLSLFAWQAISATRQQCSTFDETAHLPAGYSYLATGDFRLNPEHPPLAKLLAALPLRFLGDVHFDTRWPQWQTSDQFGLGRRFLYVDNDARRLLLWGRLPMVLLACVLGLFIYLWTCQLRGRGAATLALGLFVLSPDFLAHGALVTTDVPAATFVFMACYWLWRSHKELTLANLSFCGLSLGAALATKFNTLVFVPLFVAAPLLHAFWQPAPSLRLPGQAEPLQLSTSTRRVLGAFGVTTLLALLSLLVLWAAYGFHAALPQEHGSPLYDWADVAPRSAWVANAATLVRSVHLVPDLYLYGVLDALRASTLRVSFLLGEYSLRGFRYYFPISFLVKTPIPELVLIFAGCASVVTAARRRDFAYCALLLPAALYFGASLSSNLNIGHRHLLPMYPFLLVLAGSAAAAGLQRRWSALGVAALGLWLAWGTWSIAPSYLAYFNESVGGSRGGLNVLVDSNLDWGQDLPGLKRWMERSGVHDVYLSYFGNALPEYYGIHYEALPSFFDLSQPLASSLDLAKTSYLAVSATNLQKVYLRMSSPASFLQLLDHLRTESQPVAVIGGSIYVYRLHRRAQSGAH